MLCDDYYNMRKVYELIDDFLHENKTYNVYLESIYMWLRKIRRSVHYKYTPYMFMEDIKTILNQTNESGEVVVIGSQDNRDVNINLPSHLLRDVIDFWTTNKKHYWE